eukprot:TRINITY_DN2400_c0_g1_i1.p1 TRINITY_DN2400_c0_g1~~TRINITY_DN2400_c0_g1_i1.p1  ORF type:complete len:516 (+),score=87.15 TRINITY_DN2400_c0_g1_i1:260-1807(+)
MGREDRSVTFGDGSPFQKPFQKRKRTCLKLSKGLTTTWTKETPTTCTKRMTTTRMKETRTAWTLSERNKEDFVKASNQQLARKPTAKMEFVTIPDYESGDMFVTDLIDDDTQVEGPCIVELAPSAPSTSTRYDNGQPSEGLPNLPGFRFSPKDDELVGFWLRAKAEGILTHATIGDLDLYAFEPWELPDLSKLESYDTEWYFFTYRGTVSGRANNRGTKAGYWKATGRDKEVEVCGTKMGMKKTLVFYKGRAPSGERTDWVMHEYHLEAAAEGRDLAWVVCRVTDKTGLPAQRNSRQRGVGGARVEEAYEVLRKRGSDIGTECHATEKWNDTKCMVVGSNENWSTEPMAKRARTEGFDTKDKIVVSDDDHRCLIELDSSDVDSPMATLYSGWDEGIPATGHDLDGPSGEKAAVREAMFTSSTLEGCSFVDLMGLQKDQSANSQERIDITTPVEDLEMTFEDGLPPDFLFDLDSLEDDTGNETAQGQEESMHGLLCPPIDEVFDFVYGVNSGCDFY